MSDGWMLSACAAGGHDQLAAHFEGARASPGTTSCTTDSFLAAYMRATSAMEKR